VKLADILTVDLVEVAETRIGVVMRRHDPLVLVATHLIEIVARFLRRLRNGGTDEKQASGKRRRLCEATEKLGAAHETNLVKKQGIANERRIRGIGSESVPSPREKFRVKGGACPKCFHMQSHRARH
jgi:hypothetical protein